MTGYSEVSANNTLTMFWSGRIERRGANGGFVYSGLTRAQPPRARATRAGAALTVTASPRPRPPIGEPHILSGRWEDTDRCLRGFPTSASHCLLSEDTDVCLGLGIYISSQMSWIWYRGNKIRGCTCILKYINFAVQSPIWEP